jgi:hypothetical protein
MFVEDVQIMEVVSSVIFQTEKKGNISVIYWYKVHARTVMSITNIKLKWILNNLKKLKTKCTDQLKSLISTNQPANYIFPTIHMILVFLEIVLG